MQVIRTVPDTDEYLDAVLICGGGQTDAGGVLDSVIPRLERAAALFKEQVMRGGPPPALIALSLGTVHKPSPRDERGFPITECGSMAQHLVKRLHVSPDHVFVEGVSLDTIGNAFFARLIHTDPRAWCA